MAKAKPKAKAKPAGKKDKPVARLDAPHPDEIKAQESYFRAKLAAECQLYDAIRKVKEGVGRFTFLDSRDSEAYAAGHLPGALHVPAGDIDKIRKLDKDGSYVAYCWNSTCHLAPTLALQLSELGYHCRELNAGWEEWTKQNLPVEKVEAAVPAAANA